MSNEQSQYILDRVDFTTERYPDEIFDIKGSVVELNIYESVELPYLTASLAMSDDVAFKTTVGIKGSERVTIELKASQNSTIITKKFLVTGVAKEISVNERTDVRVLTLIEEHAYLSAIQKISETYTSDPEGIIRDILSSHLGKEIDINATNALPQFAAQRRMRVIIPQMNPLQACDWLRDRMSTSEGSPYFLYSVLRSDKIIIDELSALMKADPWNKDTPYTYAQASHNVKPQDFQDPEVSADEQLKKIFHVKSYNASKIESTLRLAQGGALGSEFNVFDLTSGQESQDGFHSGRQTMNRFLEVLGYTPESGIAFDDNLTIGTQSRGEINITNYKSRAFSSVVASRQFFQGETPISGYHDENDNFAMYKLKIKSAALRSLLMNNVFSISVPGQPYLIDKNAGVGCTIQLNYAKPTLSPTEELDIERSGKFLVYKARHKFVDGLYDVHMDIVKLTGSTS